MKFTLHVKWKNGGGAIIDEFNASSENAAIKKATDSLIKHETWTRNSVAAKLNRSMRGGTLYPIKEWNSEELQSIINKKP